MNNRIERYYDDDLTSDADALKMFRQSQADIRAGRLTDHDEVESEIILESAFAAMDELNARWQRVAIWAFLCGLASGMCASIVLDVLRP